MKPNSIVDALLGEEDPKMPFIVGKILADVKRAMDDADEISGPTGHEYADLMNLISAEALRRRDYFIKIQMEDPVEDEDVDGDIKVDDPIKQP